MIRLVVWQVPLQKVDIIIYCLDQAHVFRKQVERPDPAAVDCLYPIRHLVVDVGGREHGLVLI